MFDNIKITKDNYTTIRLILNNHFFVKHLLLYWFLCFFATVMGERSGALIVFDSNKIGQCRAHENETALLCPFVSNPSIYWFPNVAVNEPWVCDNRCKKGRLYDSGGNFWALQQGDTYDVVQAVEADQSSSHRLHSCGCGQICRSGVCASWVVHHGSVRQPGNQRPHKRQTQDWESIKIQPCWDAANDEQSSDEQEIGEAGGCEKTP